MQFDGKSCSTGEPGGNGHHIRGKCSKKVLVDTDLHTMRFEYGHLASCERCPQLPVERATQSRNRLQ